MIGRRNSPIIVGMKTTSADEYSALCDEIRTLLEQPASAPEQSLKRLEDTLTEGYARALALDAERLRIERQIGALGADLSRGARQGDEIETLAARLSHAGSRLTALRALLDPLRDRTNALRTHGVRTAIEQTR
jgi:predicted  nucleic acid-binding Zn-ribbon protein